MRTLSSQAFRFCTVAACAAIVANGCMLDRRAIISPGTLVPGEYCPGDTLTASYDFLRFAGDTCTPRSGIPNDCEANAPTVTITSTPSLFPANTAHAYQNRVDFPASGDRVDVHFAYGTGAVFVPPSTLLVNVRDNTATATRIIGSRATMLVHDGVCSGSTPTHMPAALPGPPETSANLRLIDVCNDNSATVVITLSGGASGASFSQMVAPGNCIDTSMPGVPAGVDSARIVSVRALSTPIGVRCGLATQPDAPPGPLFTTAHTACR